LQKLAAKGYPFARNFATPEEGSPVKIGYARVSPLDQHLDLQPRVLKQAGCSKIWREKVSGLNRHRPELQRLLEQ
jgi:predicted site-specific integrase-resolvase